MTSNTVFPYSYTPRLFKGDMSGTYVLFCHMLRAGFDPQDAGPSTRRHYFALTYFCTALAAAVLHSSING
jgi:hypothetical protein